MLSLKNNKLPPPDAMTWIKASPVIAICLVSDALGLFFAMFWLFGPALAAAYCTEKVSDVAIIGGLLEGACVVAAAKAGVALSVPLTIFGNIMDMAVGLFGWLTVGLILIITNARIFKENAGHALWFVVSLLISEVPIVGTVPALTITMWRLYHTQIKKDKEAVKQYESERIDALQEERQQQAAELMQMQAIQLKQSEVMAAEEIEAEKRSEEIPEEMREAA